MLDTVCPALEHIFEILGKLQKSPGDVEVLTLCAALARIQRYLRITPSNRSMHQLARSRKVVETHRLVHSDLDRLLDVVGIETFS